MNIQVFKSFIRHAYKGNLLFIKMKNPLGKPKKTRNKSDSTNQHKKSVEFIVDEIVSNADILLEVLDARFIEKTRHTEIEDKIKELGKVIIYVLNKSDLVDENQIKRQTELAEIEPYVFISSRNRDGSAVLRRLIQKEAKKLKREFVNVGVIGYPNTGKSSLINILSGRSSAKVSSESGYTKSIQKIKLSKGIYLIDTPGVILQKEGQLLPEIHARHSQIGAVTWDKTRYPDMVVSKIVRDYPGVLEEHYNIKAEGDSEVLIERLGRKLNYLRKGNEVDEMKTAKRILRDWQEGKIKH